MKPEIDLPDAPILLCCDLDRTLIPNGRQAESPIVRPLLRALAKRPELMLVYVTGRDKKLIEWALIDDCLPLPDYAVGDVGATIYRMAGDRLAPEFSEWKDWSENIRTDWRGYRGEDLADLLKDIRPLRIQEPEKQNTYKLSYYADVDTDPGPLTASVRNRLRERNIRAMVIWSVDEQENLGLLDILPERASKVQAVRFLMARNRIPESRTVCAGDSGNDLDMLTSGLQAILVRNAPDAVRREMMAVSAQKGLRDRLYFPKGDFLGMNGHYSAGVLEGLAHFFPETEKWMRSALKTL